MTTSQTFVIQGNIERYRRLIAEEPDSTRRSTIKKLLAEAEADLRALQKRHTPNGAASEASTDARVE